MKYWAFISYSHHDKSWSHALLKALETYRVPRRLIGCETRDGPRPARLMPVFLDRDELPSAHDLSGKVREALKISRYLIVICSQNAAASRWVNEEVRLFKEMGREDRVLCLVVDGDPASESGPGLSGPFPPSILRRSHAETDPEVIEPLAADARRIGDGWAKAKLKLIAGLLNVSFDELRQREQTRVRRRRLTKLVGFVALVLAVVTGYLLLADLRVSVPFAPEIRDQLDHWDLSIARRVRQDLEISEAARLHREAMFDSLEAAQMPGGWIPMSLDPNVKVYSSAARFDVWSSMQALASILRVPEVDRTRLRSVALPGLRAPFAPGYAVEGGGKKYGWEPRPPYPYTVAVPSLWAICALSEALARPGLLDRAERDEFEKYLTYAQETLRIYRPCNDGGWNMFPNQTDEAWHDPYATALALLALLQVRTAGQPWEGSFERRDALLKATASWLIEHFDYQSNPPGWHGIGETSNEIFDGLTLQVFAELLRAEKEADVSLSPEILREIPIHLARCNDRDINFPVASGENSALITDHKGQSHMATEAVRYLWYPWAIEGAVLWLRRAGAPASTSEQRVAVRRALGHLVVDLGPHAVKQAHNNWTFISAETLAGFSAVPPPASARDPRTVGRPGH